MKRIFGLLAVLAFGVYAAGQTVTPPKGAATEPATQGAVAAQNPDFLKAADEVLVQMSGILHLPIKEPLKKSLRSKDEIRAYLVKADKDDKNDAQKYADDKSLEAFGLIPKGFPLDSFMLDVLTEQVAGLYDPKGKEFYIADWIDPGEQRDVMSHELTHALEDQSFNVEPWIKAARPNDDAELARQRQRRHGACRDAGLRPARRKPERPPNWRRNDLDSSRRRRADGQGFEIGGGSHRDPRCAAVPVYRGYYVHAGFSEGP